MIKAVLASNNKNKLRELSAFMREICERNGEECELISLADAGFHGNITEDGTTFSENATIKARAASEFSGMLAIADDSGLCVDALGGAPGVYSARYSGEPCDDKRNNEKLLYELKDTKKEDRTACFVSVIACVIPDGTIDGIRGERVIEARGVCPGTVLTEPSGDGGFGYDPLFYYEPLKKTFASLTPEEKNTVSHRARAMELFGERFSALLKTRESGKDI